MHASIANVMLARCEISAGVGAGITLEACEIGGMGRVEICRSLD